MVKNKFLVIVTTAPESYDGFGTFQLSQDICNILGIDYQNLTWVIGKLDVFDIISDSKKDFRIVAINEKHFVWQTTRYSSGLHLNTKPFWQVEINNEAI